ncbi:hypothetical protein N181_01885 [Sinorhizobium fredii USDA 205]|uniref:Uncharacterized protein n=1 Tax=Rhizobium fredii TaxID=380 RepID=A0A844AI40_RHIFR|nr:hypothetical protein [Sinorhizobium fredii]KSV87375.1 hypothetical protein N181_01885 [Sinorhizobium fredii USDA 205]MQX11782.1 hypothetical protein [Sinorhizobium fredii]GEC31681.1 hypothetical protein EFR01_18520 [Sinorhizobium fredii]GLS09004.1 hypothetical protein GCM10007864_26340 [Sinorhizobium fredii]
MTITIEKLQKMTPEQRANLHENARKRLDNGGREIIELIESSGLPLSSGGMRLSDPVYQRMEEIIWSSEGKKAAVATTEAGLPALAGVEPFIVANLGDRYHPHNDGTKSAGGIVGELMRFLGYELAGHADMPAGSVAKTAALWKPRKG